MQSIGDEEQTLDIALTDCTYAVCAIGGAAATDYDEPSIQQSACDFIIRSYNLCAEL